MSKCEFCPTCDTKRCPKKGAPDGQAKISVTLNASLRGRLSDFCAKNGIMSGEKYYRVPDFCSAISLLLDKEDKRPGGGS